VKTASARRRSRKAADEPRRRFSHPVRVGASPGRLDAGSDHSWRGGPEHSVRAIHLNASRKRRGCGAAQLDRMAVVQAASRLQVETTTSCLLGDAHCRSRVRAARLSRLRRRWRNARPRDAFLGCTSPTTTRAGGRVYPRRSGHRRPPAGLERIKEQRRRRCGTCRSRRRHSAGARSTGPDARRPGARAAMHQIELELQNDQRCRARDLPRPPSNATTIWSTGAVGCLTLGTARRSGRAQPLRRACWVVELGAAAGGAAESSCWPRVAVALAPAAGGVFADGDRPRCHVTTGPRSRTAHPLELNRPAGQRRHCLAGGADVTQRGAHASAEGPAPRARCWWFDDEDRFARCSAAPRPAVLGGGGGFGDRSAGAGRRRRPPSPAESPAT